MIQDNTAGYKRIQEDPGEYRRIQGYKEGYRGIQEDTGVYRRIQNITAGRYRRIQVNIGG